MKTVSIVMPEKREGITHIVIAKGQAYLFANSNDATTFREFLITWLGYSTHECATMPLAIVNEKEWRHANYLPEIE